jgi:hypothetical protein
MKDDVESGDKEALLTPKEKEATGLGDGGIHSTSPKTDMKEAAFWLFMLFIASVLMTVGNKVCCCYCHLSNNQIGFFLGCASPICLVHYHTTTNADLSMS